MDFPAQDTVGVTFVNLLLNSGVLNGVVNLTFGTVNFDPDTNVKPNGISYKASTSCRLRMDLNCAKQLYEALARFVETDQLTEEPDAAPSSQEPAVSSKPH